MGLGLKERAVARGFEAEIYVRLKDGVADPQGSTIEHALHSLEYGEVRRVRTGTYLQIELVSEDRSQAEARVEDMCEKLLVNPVIQTYTYRLKES